jgi:hypothetical protein
METGIVKVMAIVEVEVKVKAGVELSYYAISHFVLLAVCANGGR